MFIGRTDAEVEAPILWPLDVKNWLIGKYPDSGKDWRWEEKGSTEDELVGWHHWLNGHEFEQTPGDGEGQGSLESCSPWCHKESDTTEWLNNNKETVSISSSYSSLLWAPQFLAIPNLLSASVRSIPLLSFIEPILAWNVPLVSVIFLKRLLVLPSLLFFSMSLVCSLRKTFFSPCYSLELWI